MLNSEFEEVIANGDKDKITVAFYEIAEKMADYCEKNVNWKYKTDRDDTIQEAVMWCFSKLEKYKEYRKPDSIAYNFFITITSSMFHQLRDRGNYEKLKKRYKKHLEDNNERNVK